MSGNRNATDKYADIISLPHFHVPNKPYMSLHDRAAQFAPYKSLVGYEDMIDEKRNEILREGDEVIDYNI